MPAAQGLHVDPLVTEPAGHILQELEPLEEYDPTGHVMHAPVEPAGAKVPAGQIEQLPDENE